MKMYFLFFKQKTAYEMRISDWSSDVCSSDLAMTRNGQRLLMLIDDEPAQRRLVSALAARGGWRSVFAADAEMAIAMLGTQDGMQLDAIVLDIWSPDDDAAGLIAELRARRPALPILMLTDRKSTRLNSRH